MKRNSFKILSLLLALLMTAGTLIACADTNQGNTDDTTTVAEAVSTEPEVTTSDVDKDGYKLDKLPPLNFGEEINVLAWDDVEHEEFQSDEQTGDLVLDSIYSRNITVTTRLGLTDINWIRIKGNSDNRTAWNNNVMSVYQSGGHDYDVIAGYSLSVALNASSGLLADMLDESVSPYTDFSEPWWSQLLVEQATIKGKLYFASGDISRNALEMMYVCFVNTDILKDNNLDNPQTLVPSGEWTYDKFIEMCNGVYVGQGTRNADTDTFGYMSSGIHNDPWFYGSGAVICEKDENGDIVPSPSFSGERVIDTITKFQALFASQDAICTDSVKHQNAFANGHLLFMTDRARVSHKKLAANGDLHYCIVPCPKYDVDQENYITVMGNPFTLYSTFVKSENKEMASAFIECMASEGYRKVTPAVFELSLKTKYVNDPVSSEMYDIIRANITYDLGRIFSTDLIGQGDFRSEIANTSNGWATKSSGKVKQLKNYCEKLMKSFE